MMDQPQKPLNDTVVHASIPRRDLATLALHFKRSNDPASSLSELLRKTVGYYAYLCTVQWGAEEVLSSEDATEILSIFYPRSNLNPSGRNLPAYLQNVERESKILDPGSRSEPPPTFLERTNAMKEQIEEDVEASTNEAIEAFLRSRSEERNG